MEKAEQETTITYDLEQRLVRIFSAIPSDIKRLQKAGFSPTYGSLEDGVGFEVPMDRLFWKIRPAREERQRQCAASADRGRKALSRWNASRKSETPEIKTEQPIPEAG